MTVWFVVAVPLVMMFFALAMERVENRLRHVAVQEEEVEEFLEQARPNEVRALYGHGQDAPAQEPWLRPTDLDRFSEDYSVRSERDRPRPAGR